MLVVIETSHSTLTLAIAVMISEMLVRFAGTPYTEYRQLKAIGVQVLLPRKRIIGIG